MTLPGKTALAAGPVATDDIVLVAENGSVVIPMLLNDDDADGDTLSVTGTTTPANGALSDNGDNTYTYTPTPGYIGADSFTYTVSDGSGTDTATVTISVNAAIDGEATRDALLSGVSSLAGDGDGGTLTAFGPTAYVVSYWGSQRSPMAAAASWGSGRVVALPDQQAFDLAARSGIGDTGQFFRNAIAWTTGTSDLAVGIVTYTSENRDWLQAQGYTNVTLVDETGLAAALTTADVFVPGWLGDTEPQANLDTLRDFIMGGGGLLIADFGEGYNLWWGKPVSQAPSNLLLRQAGLAFGAGVTTDNGAVPVTRGVGQVISDVLLDMLTDSTGYSSDELDEGGSVMKALFTALPADDLLMAQLDAYFTARINTINPTPDTPVSDPFEQMLLLRESALLRATPAAQVTAHRTAEALYGVIPPDAPRVNKTVTLDTSIGRWHATGLYAVPGELITVQVPPSLVGKGYNIRISAHADDISRRPAWERLPQVDRVYPIESATMEVAGAFGGPIIIDFGSNAYAPPPNLGLIDITVNGAIEQPYFVLGQHTDQEWLDTLRDKPAPYAILVSPSMIIACRSAEVAALTEPTALMNWWTDVVNGQDWLAARTTPRTGPELMNVDVQISFGAAHSGFPYQATDRVWNNPADWDTLPVEGSWGDFHELGHNHQRLWWTFDVDIEIAVNIFSNYSMENHASQPTQSSWSWTSDPIAVMDNAITSVAPGGTYSSKSSRWAFWFQLADGFGWDAYHNVMQSYETDISANRPTNEQQKRDQWLTRFSNEVGYDLCPFMVDTWGLEASSGACDSVSALPDWMPIYGSQELYTTFTDTPVTLNLTNDALTMDNIATLVAMDAAAMHGSLVNNGDGTVTYTPAPGFYGTDVFTYTVRSSGVNTVQDVAHIEVTPVCTTSLEVTSVADSGDCTLRNAVTTAVAGDTITFHPAMADKTIRLASRISIDKNLTLDGGADGTTISGDSNGDGTGDIQLFKIENSKNVTMQNLNITGGRSTSGAIIAAWYSTLTLNNMTFVGNVSTQYGGGAVHSQGYLQVNNSTFSNNRAPSAGGAITLRNNNNNIRNSTFIGNQGGSLEALTGAGWTIANTAIASASGADCSGEPPSMSVGNWIGDGGCGAVLAARTTAMNADPGLEPLADNGGPTLTYEPLSSSPLVNAGDNTTCLSTDQNGRLRTDAQCDIGSVEYNGPLAVSLGYIHSVRNGDGAVDFTWQTLTESGVAGFNVLAEMPSGFQTVNNQLIPSHVIDSVTPVNYNATLTMDSETFYLVEVGVNDATRRMGPFVVGQAYGERSEEVRQIYFPFVGRR